MNIKNFSTPLRKIPYQKHRTIRIVVTMVPQLTSNAITTPPEMNTFFPPFRVEIAEISTCRRESGQLFPSSAAILPVEFPRVKRNLLILLSMKKHIDQLTLCRSRPSQTERWQSPGEKRKRAGEGKKYQ